MSEQGVFRKSLNGFNKKDVHNYIDWVLLRHAEELENKEEIVTRLTAEVEQLKAKESSWSDNPRLEELETLLKARENELIKEKESAHKQQAEIAGYKESINRLILEKQQLNKQLSETESHFQEEREAFIQAQKHDETTKVNLENMISKDEAFGRENELLAEINRLKAELSSREALTNLSNVEAESFKNKEQQLIETNDQLREDKLKIRDQLHQCQRILAERERELGGLKHKVRENDRFLSNVGAFIMELHTLGNQVLDSASQRSEDALDSLESAINSMSLHISDAEKTLKAAKEQLSHQKAVSSSRLEELINDLKSESKA